jgi:hypothetical protein
MLIFWVMMPRVLDTAAECDASTFGKAHGFSKAVVTTPITDTWHHKLLTTA